MWARDKDSAGASLHFRPPTHSLTRHVLPRHWMTRGLLEWKNTFKYWPPSPPPIKPPPPPPSLLHSNRIENWPTLQLPMWGSCLYIFRCWCGWIVRSLGLCLPVDSPSICEGMFPNRNSNVTRVTRKEWSYTGTNLVEMGFVDKRRRRWSWNMLRGRSQLVINYYLKLQIANCWGIPLRCRYHLHPPLMDFWCWWGGFYLTIANVL